jgi:hypothetical protein
MTSAPAKSAPAAKKERRWSPRIWIGMRLGDWLTLVARNRFRISPRYWIKAALVTIVTATATALWALEALFWGRAVRRTAIEPRPLIILGHWRTGTTWLHELLALDDQFTSPSTYQTMAPNHFLISKPWASRLFFWILPTRRPMDNMPVGWDRPQEDEFALANLGVPSPYLTVAFPNEGPVYEEYLTLDVPEADRARWKETLLHFLKKVTYAERKRLIVKSPPHTARVKTLLEMFPDARFVYLVRDPFVLFSSTVNLWRKLYEAQGMQVPTFAGIEEHVFTTFARMHERFERDRGLIPAGRLYELRYEDLIQAPTARLAEMYEQLELGDFGRVREAVERFVADNADYQTNRYELSPERREEIARRWAGYISQHDYA